MMNAIVKFLGGVFLFGVGITVGLVEIIALLDPVGTKMADDADPFGDPYIPRYVHAVYILITLGCFYFGYLLMRSAEKKR
jgi:hypothetical protein